MLKHRCLMGSIHEGATIKHAEYTVALWHRLHLESNHNQLHSLAAATEMQCNDDTDFRQKVEANGHDNSHWLTLGIVPTPQQNPHGCLKF